MFLRGIVTSAFFVLVSCDAGKDDTADYSKSDKTTLAYIYCGGWAAQICDAIEHICADEFDQAYPPPDYAGYDEWEYRCQIDITEECVPSVLAIDDIKDGIFVVQHACPAGVSEDRIDARYALTCDDVTDSEDNYAETWPRNDLCPCIETGEYHYSEADDDYICGPQPGKESLLSSVYHAVVR